jgi:thiamine-phosphate pyrophosphorylase
LLERRALGVYVVTSAGLVPRRTHLDVAVAAIAGGATAIQVRAPELDRDRVASLAGELVEPCARAGVLLVVNDRVDVAAELGLAAHVGQGDDPRRARELLGPDAILGVSVEDVAEALAAADLGADYLGVTVWATPTKPQARPRGLDGLRAVAGAVDLPVVAIGGIDAGNARAVLDAGAAGVAVVSAVGAAEDPVGATRGLVAIVGARRVA